MYIISMGVEGESGITRRHFLANLGKLALASATLSACDPNTKLPFRSIPDAISACNLRRLDCQMKMPQKPLSDLEVVLNTSFSENNRIGLVNGHLWDESEMLDIGNISFAVKPWDFIMRTETEQVPLFTNVGVDFTIFRNDQNSEESLTRVFDRVVWAASQKRRLSAVLEMDRYPQGKDAYRQAAGILGFYGVNLIMGNEPNDPYTSDWLGDYAMYYKVLIETREELARIGLTTEISTPGFACFGDDGAEMRKFFELGSKYGGGFSFDRIADHSYVSVEEFLDRIRFMKNIAKEKGLGGLSYDLKEVGPVEPENLNFPVTDRQIAEGDMCQKLVLAMASGLVDQIDYFSLYYKKKPEYSLARVAEGRLLPKDSYQAFRVITKLLARMQEAAIKQDKNMTRVRIRRTDGVNPVVIWANDREQGVRLNEDQEAYDVFGNRLPGKWVVLPEKTCDAFSGSARIII